MVDPLNDKGRTLALPFPDLTGLRAAAHNRVTNPTFFRVERQSTLLFAQLRDITQKVAAVDVEEVILGAWAIVLILLLSHEDDFQIAFRHNNSGQWKDVHIALDRSQIEMLDLKAFFDLLRASSRPASAESCPDTCVEVLSQSNDTNMSSEGLVKLLFSETQQGGPLKFFLVASSKVHTKESAELHLDQVLCCIDSFFTHHSTTALSTERYPTAYLAADNALPSPTTIDTNSKGLEYERFEDQFLRMVQKYPDSAALDFRSNLQEAKGEIKAGNYCLTYDDLARQSALTSQEIKVVNTVNRNDVIALCLEKSHWTYLAILAVLRIGAAWCPIDTDWPADRRKALLKKSGAKVVLTAADHVSEELIQVLPQGMQMIRLDELDMDAIPKQDIDAEGWRDLPTSNDLAYLIWTSGTTGLPKAVGIQHYAAVQALRALQCVIPHNGSEIRYLQFSAYNFDLMILDVFYTWGLGGTLCSSTRTILLSNLVEVANAFQASHTLLTPAVMAMTPREAIPSLQVVINGGEKLSQIVADTWSINCCLLNLYGPAEATLIAMNRKVPVNDVVKAPNIGVALPTTSCHALDNKGNIVIKGAVGELVIGGHQCAKGYIGDPDKTADKFVQHKSLGRIYHTGDLVRQLHNGDFEYLGRADDQVKINGIRIELLEINATIRGADIALKDSETLVVPIEGGQESSDVQIVNFSVMPCSGSTPNGLIRDDDEALTLARKLTHYAHAKLPSYMVPSLFVLLTFFPKTSSAKIDRQSLKMALKKFDIIEWQNRLASADDDIYPVDERLKQLESDIASHIAEICRLESSKIGRNTPLPTLGLDSIRAITLARKLNLSGINISVVDIVQNATLARIAATFIEKSPETAQRAKKALQALNHFDHSHRHDVKRFLTSQDIPNNIEKVLPASPLQEGLVLESLQDKHRYWLTRVYTFSADVDVGRFKRALQDLTNRLEILRTFFVAKASLQSENEKPERGLIQVVLAHHPVNVATWGDSVGSTNLSASRLATKTMDFFNQKIIHPTPPVHFAIFQQSSLSRFVMHIHHALYDQISLQLMEEELQRIYLSKQPLSLTPFSNGLPYILSLNTEESNKQELTRHKLLADFPRGLSMKLPSFSGKESPRSASQIDAFSLTSKISYSKLTSVALQTKSSVRPFIQAVLGSILCHFIDSQHILLGDSVSGRVVSAELDNVVGPVLSTVPIPIHVNGALTYRDLASNIENFQRESLRHAHIPLSKIKQILQIPGSSPLFHAMFVLEPPLDEEATSFSSLLTREGDFGISVEHDIAVEVGVTSTGFLRLGINVRKGFMNADFGSHFLSVFENGIDRAIEQPDLHVLDLSAALPKELLSITQEEIPERISNVCQTPVFRSIEDLAVKAPFRTAVEFFETSEDSQRPQELSYASLESISTALGSHLFASLPAKSVVSVTLSRSLWSYIVLLAILKSGHIYLPIDISLPEGRKQLLFEESNARCLIYDQFTKWDPCIQEQDILCICLDSTTTFNAPEKSTVMPTPAPNDLAYILYTSGSTGKPKGCCLTHENLSAAIESFKMVYEKEVPGSFKPDVRFLARSIESFDVALLETLLPLQVGGTIVTAPRHVILSDIGKAMRGMAITHAAVVPSLFFSKGKRITPTELPNLRALIVGGERVTRDILETWTGSHIPLLNAYGPTEACIGTSIARLDPNDSTGNIGKPFASTQYLVIKNNKPGQNRLAIKGEAGELCISGRQLGSYLKQSGNQAFTSFEGRQIYRTGDEARMWPDGSIEYIGRIGGDSQVKVRGVRIELGEIDANLKDVSKVARHVVTRSVRHPSWDSEQIVSFVSHEASIRRNDSALHIVDSKEAREELLCLRIQARKRLPTYMVPSVILLLNNLPLAPLSGKTDSTFILEWFKALDSAEFQQVNKFETVRGFTEEEEPIAEEVRRLLPHNITLGPQSDLYSLGFDSFSFLTLAGSLSTRGLKLDIGQLMGTPTVEGIVSFLTHQRRAEAKTDNPGIVEDSTLIDAARRIIAQPVASVYPTLPLQVSMITKTLTAYQNEQASGNPETLPYINVSEFQCKSKTIDVSRLGKAINMAIASHDIYRSVFVDLDGHMHQAVLSEIQTERYAIQLSPNMHTVQREIAKTLDKVPPLRYRIDQHEGQTTLLLVLHHALYDGVSLDALMSDIAHFYKTEREPPHQSYKTFATFVKEVMVTPEDVKLAFWKDHLSGASIAPFPNLTGQKVSIGKSVTRSAQIFCSDSLESLQKVARSQRVTLALYALETFASLYGKYVGENEVTVGLVLAGRDITSIATQGPCVNTVPMRLLLDDDEANRSNYAMAHRYQHINLAKLRRELDTLEDLFHVLFSYIAPTAHEDQLFETAKSEMATGYPLALEVEPDEDANRVLLRLSYDTQYVPDEQAYAILRQLDSLLKRRAYPDEESVLSIENTEACNHQLQGFLDFFREEVVKRPNDLAYTFTNALDVPFTECTYADLDSLSDRIANSLEEVPGNTVGVCLRQCLEIYALLVGIWKAGKTYLPLDPTLPDDRLEYMVSVTDPQLIVTNQEYLGKAIRLNRNTKIADTLLNENRRTNAQHTAITLEQPAYIMFTSGSSGRPKGVQVSHRALGAALLSWKYILPHRPGKSRLLQLASPGFDVFLIEVCMPLALGFSFASAPKEILLDDLETTFHALQLTMADLPAALATTVEPTRLPALEWLMSGGDQVDERVIKLWSSTGLINAWGPTEATVGNTLGFLNDQSSRNWIGKAYPTSSLFVLNPQTTEILPRGCLGELAVGGPQVADCYVGNPALTEEKFVSITLPNTQQIVRVYRTGDKGRLLMDSSVECLGRLDGDGQVKINSQRVELREIELALLQDKDIHDAAVVYTEHKEMHSKQLVAFIILKDEGGGSSHTVPGVSQIRDDDHSRSVITSALLSAEERLAAYMVPHHLLALADPAIPLTPNDKKDTRALKQIFQQLKAKDIRLLHPRSGRPTNNTSENWSALEQKLRDAIVDFLGVPKEDVGRDESLHRLGVDSISGFRLVNHLRARGFDKLTVRSILKSPTIRSLARWLQGSMERDDDGASLLETWKKNHASRINTEGWSIGAHDAISHVLPCTSLQQGLLVESLASDGKLYVHHHTFQIKPEVQECVIQAFETVFQYHEILRTSFHLEFGEFVQAVHEDAPQLVDILSMPDVPLHKIQQELLQRRYFSTEQALTRPPVRLIAVKSGPYMLLDLVIHHALYDGETLNMLFDEVESIVSGKLKNIPTIQFQDVLPSLLSTSDNVLFWTKCLSGRRHTTLRRQGGVSPTSHSYLQAKVLPLTASQIQKAATRYGVSMHIMALSAFAKVLVKLTEQRDIVFAQLFGLRDAVHGANLVFGPALNTTLTPVDIIQHESTISFLRRLQKDNDEAREHRSASLYDVQRSLAGRSNGEFLRFDALFDFQRSLDSNSTSEKEAVLRPLAMEASHKIEETQYGLNVEFVQEGENVSIVATGRADFFTEETLQSTLDNLFLVLEHTMYQQDGGLATEMPSGQGNLDKFAISCTRNNLNGQIRTLVPVQSEEIRDDSQEISENSDATLIPTIEQMRICVADMVGLDAADIAVGKPLQELGLDSIAAIRLASKLRTEGLMTGVADILQGKTIIAIASRIHYRSKVTHVKHDHLTTEDGSASDKIQFSQMLGIKLPHVETVLEVLPGQAFELTAAAHSKEKGYFSFIYSLNNSVRIDGTRMESAWKALRKHHAILRTRFAHLNGMEPITLRQVVLAKDQVDIDLSFREVQTEKTVSEWVQLGGIVELKRWHQESGETESFCTCFHVKAADQDVVVLLLHHALYDAWSLPLLADDLSMLYYGACVPQLRSSAHHVQYSQFVAGEKRKIGKEAKVYWRNLLSGVQSTIVGTEKEYAKSYSSETSFMFFRQVITQASSLEASAQRMHCHLTTAILGAWALVLQRLTGMSSGTALTFGHYQIGRSSAFVDVEKLATNCMNVLPIIAHVEKKQSSPQALWAVAQKIKDQMENHSHLDNVVSMPDILRWNDFQKAPWNTYINLLWGGEDADSNSDNDGRLNLDQSIMTQDAIHDISAPSSLEGSSKMCSEIDVDLRSEVNIDVQLDRQTDSVHVGVRWRADIFSVEEITNIVHELGSHVATSCASVS